MSELKPCPFCGSLNLAIAADDNDDGVPCDIGRKYYYVLCSECGGQTRQQTDFTEAQAIYRWNRRPKDE